MGDGCGRSRGWLLSPRWRAPGVEVACSLVVDDLAALHVMVSMTGRQFLADALNSFQAPHSFVGPSINAWPPTMSC